MDKVRCLMSGSAPKAIGRHGHATVSQTRGALGELSETLRKSGLFRHQSVQQALAPLLVRERLGMAVPPASASDLHAAQLLPIQGPEWLQRRREPWTGGANSLTGGGMDTRACRGKPSRWQSFVSNKMFLRDVMGEKPHALWSARQHWLAEGFRY